MSERRDNIHSAADHFAEPQTIFCVTRKIVAAIMKIFSFGQTMFCGIQIIVWMIQTVFRTTETIVTAAQKMVSFMGKIL